MSRIQAERIRELNRAPIDDKKSYVLYWMQQAQRTRFNHALEFAAEMANELDIPVIVCFVLNADFPDANARHYSFMLEGLTDVAGSLKARGVQFVLHIGHPREIVGRLSEDAAALVCDRGYLRIQKEWRKEVSKSVRCAMFEIESDVVVPVETASQKSEYAARTIRPKITKLLPKFLKDLKPVELKRSSLSNQFKGESLDDLSALLGRLKVSKLPAPVPRFFLGGERAAQARLKKFLRDEFDSYSEDRNHPSLGCVSKMSMYLHFGQISPLDIALQVIKLKGSKKSKEVFLEELLVRRELAMNFAHYNYAYDTYSVLPRWALATLAKHSDDERQYLYTEDQLEAAQTHDPYWNASMLEMKLTGFMHNYMRMYWGKKVLEWTRSPEEAYRILIKLNNKYFLCGRDPNGYANVLWVFGLHDRPWGERDVYGTIRSMTASGLKRKTDIDAYVEKIAALANGKALE